MLRAFWSEWLKIRRPGMLLGGAGTMMGFAVLAVALTLNRLGTGSGPARDLTAAMLDASNGFALLIANAVTLFGVVALAVGAVAVGMEYSNGTLRNLLVRQPGRLQLLAGKLVALASFVAIAVVLATGVGLVTALVMAPSYSISTTAWLTGEGVRSMLSTTGNLLLSTVAWGAIGAVLAVVLRSTAIAIAGGLAYILVVESLLSATISGSGQWLPGQLIATIAHGGTSDVSYTSALILVGIYLVAALGLAASLFRSRDVAV
jgi:ABC-type transport system involved in multi-copper enzyme maturation permease subunit